MNITSTLAARQFDRLALDGVDSVRASMAGSTQHGIVWSYFKDMSGLIAQFGQPAESSFVLGNRMDDTYADAWHTTPTAILFHRRGSAGAGGCCIPGICAQISRG